MTSSYIIHFADARPFERFRVYLADGRHLDVTHPEMVLVATYALGLWIFYPEGQLEVVDGDSITGLRTLDKVTPGFIGPEQTGT